MAWFRRRRSAPDPSHGAASGDDTDAALVPLASSEALQRTERALRMLATQSSQLHSRIVQLEHRIDAISASVLDQLETPSFQDVLDARVHSAKVAAELSRLEVNLAARLETVQSRLRRLEAGGADADDELDLRRLSPTDTGWSRAAS